MTVKHRWFEYGEPTGDGRVEAAIRTTYERGPNDPHREDDVVTGTIELEALDMMDENEEIQYHTHDDFSVWLDGLSMETEEEFLETFEAEED